MLVELVYLVDQLVMDGEVRRCVRESWNHLPQIALENDDLLL